MSESAGESGHWSVENGHHLAVTKRGQHNVIPREWRCRGCDGRFESKNLDECTNPTVWVQLGTPGDGVGHCRDCDTLFVFERTGRPFYEDGCPECGSIDWFRSDETDVDPGEVLELGEC